MSLHKNLTGQELHSVHSFTYANASARNAASLTSDDIGKIALQNDNNSFWLLTSVSPVTWSELTRTTADSVVGTVIVGKSGSVDFNNVADAVAYVKTKSPSINNPWVIFIYPGFYVEQNPIVLPLGIFVSSVSGDTQDLVDIRPVNSLDSLFVLNGGILSGLTLSGVNEVNKSLIEINTNVLSRASTVKDCGFFNCSRGITIQSGAIGVISNCIFRVVAPNSAIGVGIYVDGGRLSGSRIGFAVSPAIMGAYSVNPIDVGIQAVNGATADINTSSWNILAKNVNQVSILASGNNTRVAIQGGSFNNGNIAIKIASGASTVSIQSSSIINYVYNYVIESSTGVIYENISTDSIKQNIVPGATVTGITFTSSDQTTYLYGNTHYTFLPEGRSLDFNRYFFDKSSSGLVSGGKVTASNGLDVNISDGYGWVRRASDIDVTDVYWNSTSRTLSPNATNYVFYNGDTLSISSNTTGTNSNNIQLATVVTNGSGIRFIHNTSNIVTDVITLVHDYLLRTRKFSLANGLATSIGSSPTQFSIDLGSYYIATTLIEFDGYSDAYFSSFYDNGNTEIAGQTDVDLTQYDDGGTLTTMDDGYYRADTVYLTSDGRISLIYGSMQFESLDDVIKVGAALAPSFIEPSGMALANLIIEKNVGISTIVDLRPSRNAALGGGGGGGGGGISDHGLLSGLGDDDHPQYLLGDGLRSMSGNLDMGGNNIVNVNHVDGVDVSSHAARHNPDQIDALATGVPVPISIGAATSQGTALSFARSDHQHGIAAGTPVSINSVNSAGVAATIARSDHVHAHGNLGGGSQHSLVIADPGGTAGFMSPSDKQKLDGVEAGATNTPLSNVAPINVTVAAATAGVSTEVSRQDHKHSITTAAAGTISIGDISTDGVANSLSRSDHKHALPAPPAPTNVTKASASAGVATTVARSDHKHDIDTAIAGTISIGDVAAEGSATSLARSDHTHALPAPLAPANITKTTAAAGVSSTVARSDHKHDVDTAAAGTISIGDVASEGSSTSLARADHVHALTAPSAPVNVTKATASAGVATTVARSDHKHDISTAVAGTISVGDVAAEGSASTLARSDHTHALAAPPAPANVDANTASSGVATTVARSDHKHNVNVGTPVAIGTANAAGSATTLVRSDHVHRGTFLQSVFAEISTDTTTTSATFVDLISQSITTTGGDLLIQFTASASNTNNTRNIRFRITVDGVSIRGSQINANTSNTAESTSIVTKVTGLSASSHTVKIQWLTSANTAQIRPVAAADVEHGSLLITEVTV